jgi:pimeloyl-ACP methyl ester carboxylesterase
MFVPDATHEQVEWFDALLRAAVRSRDVRRLQHAASIVDVTPLLPAVRAPTLVLHARHDGVAPFEEGRLLASSIPGARFVALESRNHILLEHEPAWARFRDEFRRFLGADS